MEKQQPSQLQLVGRKFALILQVGSAVKQWKKLARQSKDRYFRIKELVSTQADYLRDLTIIQERLQGGLLERKIITEEEAAQLFPNIVGMKDLSRQLHAEMQEVLERWDRHRSLIAARMILYSQFMLVYSEFFKGYYSTQRRLQWLLETQPEATLVQQTLVQPPRVQTFDNLLSKPFQRPLKYHLLLKDYHSKLSATHPDYDKLEQAIHCFHLVNQRNNRALENKEKEETLLTLDNKFGGIIDSQARYFVAQTNAQAMDVPVKLYIFSNLVLLVRTDLQAEAVYMRLDLDQASFVASLRDGLHIKQRILICGKKQCVHLHFDEQKERHLAQRHLSETIHHLYSNEFNRQMISSSRRVTFTHRQSLFQETSHLRESYLQKSPILPKPPRILIQGVVRRDFSSKVFKIYYLVRFQLPLPDRCMQILWVDQQALLSLQRTLRQLYRAQLQTFAEIESLSKLISNYESKNNEVKWLEFKCSHAVVLLNAVFRNFQISKRTDLIAHCLGVWEPIWLRSRFSELSCTCGYCAADPSIDSLHRYSEEIQARNQLHQTEKTFYCPFRTIRTQLAVRFIDPKTLVTAVDRVFWMRCYRGELDFRVLEGPPLERSSKKKVGVRLPRVEAAVIELQIGKQERVGQVLGRLQSWLGYSLTDYQLCMSIGKQSPFPLGRDEILSKLLDLQQPSETHSIWKLFGELQDNSMRIELRKLWVFDPESQIASLLAHPQRVLAFLEEFTTRLKNDEIHLSLNDTNTLYAAYLAYRRLQHPSPILETHLALLISPAKWAAMSLNKRKSLLDVVSEKAAQITAKCQEERDKSNEQQTIEGRGGEGRSIWEFVVRMGRSRPGWSAFMFPAVLVNHPQYEKAKSVEVGVDWQRLYVKEKNKISTILEYKLAVIAGKMLVSGWELHLYDEEREYVLTGSHFAQLQQIADFYLDFQKAFLLSL